MLERGLSKETDPYENDRLQQLSSFQISILTHALSFPHVTRVVYSTCSVHEIENENVVEKVYAQVKDKFEIEHILLDWPCRGLGVYPCGARCLRMSPDQTLTNGFFVACFVRRNSEPTPNGRLKSANSKFAQGLNALEQSASNSCPQNNSKSLSKRNICAPENSRQSQESCSRKIKKPSHSNNYTMQTPRAKIMSADISGNEQAQDVTSKWTVENLESRVHVTHSANDSAGQLDIPLKATTKWTVI